MKSGSKEPCSGTTIRPAVFWPTVALRSTIGRQGGGINYRRRPSPRSSPAESSSKQAPYVEPLVEIDDRAGFYGAVSWENYQFFEVNALYFDNRGIPDRVDGEQYSWKTRFTNVGAVAFLPVEMELLGQFMSGNTNMGFRGPDEPKVTADFRS